MSGAKRVEIKWNDHWSCNSWDDRPMRPLVVSSVGYLFKEDQKGVVLCRDDESDSANARQFLYIMKKDIVRRKVLR